MSETLTADEELQARIAEIPKAVIGPRIKEARQQAGLTLDRLGELCGGVTRQHLIKLEKAQHRPGPDMLRRIAAATTRTVDSFVDPEVDPARPFRVDGDL